MPSYAAVSSFLGYGNREAPIWAVGLEEHCREDELPTRLQFLSELGAAGANIGIRTFHRRLADRTPDGPTKRSLGRILNDWHRVSTWHIANRLASQILSRPVPNEPDENVFFSEILPLPRPTHDSWPTIYQQLEGFPQPNEYLSKENVASRGRRLIDLIAQFRPQVVFLHGKTRHDKWTKIVLGASPTNSWTIGGTVIILTANFVNNGWVKWGEEQIRQVADAIPQQSSY